MKRAKTTLPMNERERPMVMKKKAKKKKKVRRPDTFAIPFGSLGKPTTKKKKVKK